GLWNDRDVIVKVFSHKISAKRHLKREWRGLSILRQRGLSSPEPLFFGQTEDGQWTVVVEKIINALTIGEVWDNTTDAGKKRELLCAVSGELAKQHSKGVLQKDLHLGNFLLSGDKVFTLDLGQMQFFSRPITRSKSISQLASLACYLAASDTESIARLCEEYFKAHCWRFSKSDELFLQKQLTVNRKRGVSKGLKKCLRTSKRHLQLKFRIQKFVAVFDRDFCQTTEPLDFIEQIDALMDGGQILKHGRTSYVSRIGWNGKDVVVKRYNHKGFIHSLRHTIKGSRARRGWLHAHRLGMLNIATPRPLAYIEQRKRMLVWKSYLITEYVEGQRLYDFLRDSKTGEEERSKVSGQVWELFERLGEYRISHGDLKHSNILITGNVPVLTDLDGVKVHKWNWIYRMRRRKDLRRFRKQLPECSCRSLFEKV
ncbi:MAG: lipopolysaccharide kinase InaA family protein, partial [Sedimentisphaerales bacterium]